MNKLKISMVSDVVCPWCVIGYKHMETALQNLNMEADWSFYPFQLNPSMGPEGQLINEHLVEKYGLNEQQLEENKAHIQGIGKEAGFDFNFAERSRIYNTFDAHVLLHWAGTVGKQKELKMALFEAYFSKGINISDISVLLSVIADLGLSVSDAERALIDSAIRKQVKLLAESFLQQGISSVPAFIINEKYLISGGQPLSAFEQALRQICEQEEAAQEV